MRTAKRGLLLAAAMVVVVQAQVLSAAGVAEGLLAQATAAEWASRSQKAIGLYKKVMEIPGAKDAAVVEAAERLLILQGRSMDSTQLLALREDVCKRLTGPTARGQVTIAVARRLVWGGDPVEARDLLEKLPEGEIPKGYREEAQGLVGKELLRLAHIDVMEGRSPAAVAKYEQVLSDDRFVSWKQQRRAKTRLVRRLIAAGRIGRLRGPSS